ncbi:MAG: bifunctional riboflavin kinase/FAD synthetase [Desulfuromonadaceae bacterium]
MKIIRNLAELTSPLCKPILTIGNFDGVHLGHREIFQRLVHKARSENGTSVVLTFVPHPLKVLAPAHAPRLLNTHAEKERLIEASHIDVLICLPFDQQLANMSADQFVKDILVQTIGVHHLIVGYDYTFGHNREGNVTLLQQLGKKYNFGIDILEPLAEHNVVYSSSLVRKMICAGDVAGAVRYLGRHFTLEGVVSHGLKRGRHLGFPTANLITEKEILPIPGVYAVKVRRGERLYDGVLNIGWNPTFGNQTVTVEVHLLDFDGDLYGEVLRIYFFERLRNEKRFDSVQDLIAAIQKDIARARQILSSCQLIDFREYLNSLTTSEDSTPYGKENG